MTCPVCQLDRIDCPACAGVCPTCAGAGEVADNPGWPDPQCEERYECPTCKGEGMAPMLNPDFNTYPETYTERCLRHTREDTVGALFDEAFDELLARQDRVADWAGEQVPRQAEGTVKGAGVSEAGSPPDSSRAFPLAPRNDPSSGGRPVLPSGPATSEDERRAA